MAASQGFWVDILIFSLLSDLDKLKMFFMDLSNLDNFRNQIAEAQSRIQSLYAMRRVVDDQISDLRDLIRANANFLPDAERRAELLCLEMLKVPETIAEAVKAALFLATIKEQKLTPTEIRDIAQKRGFNFGDYSNAMASIHAVLKRMREADPPDVEFDEKSGAYSLADPWPGDVTDESFYDQLNGRAWNRVLTEDGDRASVIAQEVVNNFMLDIVQKPKRLKK